MPLSSDGEAIDFIYGVINWKEMADSSTLASLADEVDRAAAAPAVPVWADGPSAAAAETAADAETLSLWPEAADGSPTGSPSPVTAPTRRRQAPAAAGRRFIARSAMRMNSPSPRGKIPPATPSCSPMPASRSRRARR